MRLYLVQHGEAVAKDIDPGRPLSANGEQEVRNLAAFLETQRVNVERIVHSGKLRARQTAEILAEKLLFKGEVVAISGIDPGDSVIEFSPRAHKLKQHTMLVGHLPFLGKLIAYLTTGHEEHDIVAYHPGSCVCLERDPEKDWRVCWMLRPDLIK